MTLMTAVRAHDTSGELRVERIPVPEPGPGDVLVRVAAAGLTPVILKHLRRGAFGHLPATPGHEIAGTVEAVGPGANPALVGARVRVHPMLSCGACRSCRTDREQMCPRAAMIGSGGHGDASELYARYHDGGFAEFVRVPAAQVDALPDAVGFEVGAKVHDFANAVRALKGAALGGGGTLVVTAATGTMGTATAALARFFGADRLVLVARSADRLAAVAPLAGPLPVETVALDDLGRDWAARDGLTRRLRDLVPDGPDAVVDYLPQGPGTAQAAASLATGGTFVHMGGNTETLPFPIRVVMRNCWRIVGTRGCTRSDTDAVLDILGRGEVRADELVTHRYPLAEITAALDAADRRAEPMWMTVLHP
ncbi:alcohol dehydrogenase catalytic domain-containing protein [Actinomadura atramentaria]|uniref:alcohol dehydrogenase catalytic domain-containing protein n=1 Tax=Actinomadura atramentaria TaxID=1990 RepID=UPI00036783CF|nr:alcohol dehydrogenase catalytic domain-containing protein [Actinomadura atramentaria]